MSGWRSPGGPLLLPFFIACGEPKLAEKSPAALVASPPIAPRSPAPASETPAVAEIDLPATPFATARFFVSELVPPPRLVREASTYALSELAVPDGGVRERKDGVEVISAPFAWTVDGVRLGGGVLDGLREGERVYVAPTLSPDDRATYAEIEARHRDWRLRCPSGRDEGCYDDIGHAHDRLVRIAHVGPDTVSAWIATSDYTFGAAHANNVLSCATWSRRTGQRLMLSDGLGAAEVQRRLEAMDRVRRYAELGGSDEDYYRLGFSALDEATWPTGDTDNFLIDGKGDPIVCMPVWGGAGNGTFALRFGVVETVK